MLSGSYNPGSLYLFRRNVDGTFAAGQELAGEDGKPLNVGAAAHVSAADWTGDGKLDLVAVSYVYDTASVLLNNGDGTFAAKVDYPTGVSPSSVAAADLNGDGKIDLAVPNNAIPI